MLCNLHTFYTHRGEGRDANREVGRKRRYRAEVDVKWHRVVKWLQHMTRQKEDRHSSFPHENFI
jgi:hypothetical protein